MRALPDPAFAFGDFIFVPKERLLLRGGVSVPLTAKAFDLLAILVQRSGHLVSKDELFEEVWPNTTVQETNLTVNISALRKALGGARNGSEFIQTVPGRGYRFVAPVFARHAMPGVIACGQQFGCRAKAGTCCECWLRQVIRRGQAPGVGAHRRSRCVHRDRGCSLARDAAKNRCRVRLGGRAAFPQ